MIEKKNDIDDALRARLAHVTLCDRPISVPTKDEPLRSGYTGTIQRASLCPETHLRWNKQQLDLIYRALAKDPLTTHIKQLLLYGIHSKINHTLCHMVLSSSVVA